MPAGPQHSRAARPQRRTSSHYCFSWLSPFTLAPGKPGVSRLRQHGGRSTICVWAAIAQLRKHLGSTMEIECAARTPADRSKSAEKHGACTALEGEAARFCRPHAALEEAEPIRESPAFRPARLKAGSAKHGPLGLERVPGKPSFCSSPGLGLPACMASSGSIARFGALAPRRIARIAMVAGLGQQAPRMGLCHSR